jgi:hypothetical protein
VDTGIVVVPIAIPIIIYIGAAASVGGAAKVGFGVLVGTGG